MPKYYAIPIHPSHRKYLRFVYQSRVYEFQCLPFGLSSAPRAFTKTLKPVLAVLCSLGIRIVIYIDDMLLLHQQSKVLQRMFAQVVAFLEKLGFLVKSEKRSVAPSQCIVFLGAKLDFSLPQPKLSTILDTCQVLLAQGCVPMRTLSTLIGRMSHASQTGITMAPLRYRGFQRLHLQTVAQQGHGSRVSISLNYQALADLKWWVSESEHLNGCPVQQPPIDATIWSDASKKCWGAAYQGISTRGHWSVDEAKAHINVLVLQAATLALKALLNHQLPVPKHVHLRLDNTTAVAYINKRGGTNSPALTTQALEMWAVALEAGVSVTAQHIPGIRNGVADTASRELDSRTEWTMDKQIFQSICQRFYTPEVDLFASRLTHQVPKYVSRYTDPGVLAVDAFLQDWSKWSCIIHPPVVLLPRPSFQFPPCCSFHFNLQCTILCGSLFI